MNFVELMELNRAISALHFKKSKISNCQIYDAQKEGYCIVIKKEYVDDSCLNQLTKIAKEQNLELNTSDKYYIISSPYTWIDL